jgi:hypothetical protein
VNESRTSAIVAGAALVAGSLWAPWYALDFSPAIRNAASARVGQLPAGLRDFLTQIIAAVPAHLDATAWQVFEKTDVVLFACAVVAVVAALVDRMDIAAFAGAGAAGATVLAMLDRPLPSEIASLAWGAWLSLAGALVIVGASRIGSRRPVAAAVPPPDWTKPTAGAVDPAQSFPPF